MGSALHGDAVVVGQRPAAAKGGWLQASYGKGYYTYFAYALHRELPYGVAGAYRLTANLLSLTATSTKDQQEERRK